MDRRAFIRGMCYGGVATFAAPLVTFAQVPARGRFVFVLLRGGFDGLAAVVPVGDPGYAALRGSMAFSPNDLIPLSGPFALAPGLSGLRAFWDAGELVAIHALAIPYRTRSHFDGQAVLETGLDRPVGASDGWLNRLLQVMEGERSGIAISAGMPRSLSGSYPVLTWSPADFGVVGDAYLERLHLLYQRDAILHDRFEAAIQLQELQEEGGMADPSAGGRLARAAGMAPLMAAVARFLREPAGPNVAAVEFSGWDTHASQGMARGPLDRRFAELAEALATLKQEMVDAWAGTTVVVMTEFGRTARPNGSGGTDHGTAGAGFVLGSRVARSAIVSDWPGLGEADLYERRDLRPTLDTRAILKGVVRGTFDLTEAQADRIFPGSEGVRSTTAFML
jgi:uncharacterized protein (DUF1501 family)